MPATIALLRDARRPLERFPDAMDVSVRERRSEIGRPCSLGATVGQIRTQFLTESILHPQRGGDYFKKRDVVLSARTLPPVWQVGQYATV